MARVNIAIVGNSELKWTQMGEFNSDDHYIYYCGQESLGRKGVAIMVNKSSKCSTWMQSQKRQNDLCCFQGKPFNITVIQVYALPGASTGDLTHDKVMWKRPDKQGFRTRETPWTCWASSPKPESVCLTILCLSPTLLTSTGGYPWPPFSGENQLRALANKPFGHERSISIQTPLLAF